MIEDVIRTNRLELRRFEIGHARELHAIFSDPEAMRYWSTLPHSSVAETEQFVAETMRSVLSGESDDFVVLHGGAVIGKAGLWRNTELGMIFARDVWGSGMPVEAVRAVIDRATRRGAREITADVDPRNARALNFLDRLGFVKTGAAERTFRIGH